MKVVMAIAQPRPQGFSLKKWVGRDGPWGRGWAIAKCQQAKILPILPLYSRAVEFV